MLGSPLLAASQDLQVDTEPLLCPVTTPQLRTGKAGSRQPEDQRRKRPDVGKQGQPGRTLAFRPGGNVTGGTGSNVPSACHEPVLHSEGTTGAQFGHTRLLEGPVGKLPLTEPQEVQHPLPTRIQKGAIAEPRDTVPLGPHQPGNCD